MCHCCVHECLGSNRNCSRPISIGGTDNESGSSNTQTSTCTSIHACCIPYILHKIQIDYPSCRLLSCFAGLFVCSFAAAAVAAVAFLSLWLESIVSNSPAFFYTTMISNSCANENEPRENQIFPSKLDYSSAHIREYIISECRQKEMETERKERMRRSKYTIVTMETNENKAFEMKIHTLAIHKIMLLYVYTVLYMYGWFIAKRKAQINIKYSYDDVRIR